MGTETKIRGSNINVFESLEFCRGFMYHGNDKYVYNYISRRTPYFSIPGVPSAEFGSSPKTPEKLSGASVNLNIDLVLGLHGHFGIGSSWPFFTGNNSATATIGPNIGAGVSFSYTTVNKIPQNSGNATQTDSPQVSPTMPSPDVISNGALGQNLPNTGAREVFDAKYGVPVQEGNPLGNSEIGKVFAVNPGAPTSPSQYAPPAPFGTQGNGALGSSGAARPAQEDAHPGAAIDNAKQGSRSGTDVIGSLPPAWITNAYDGLAAGVASSRVTGGSFGAPGDLLGLGIRPSEATINEHNADVAKAAEQDKQGQAASADLGQSAPPPSKSQGR
jgi:hypothetical protein